MLQKTFILIFDVILISVALTLIQTVSPWFSFLLTGLFLFPILRMSGLIRDLDEREKAVDNLSSNIALAIVFLLAMFYTGMGYEIGTDCFISFILIPFAAKAIFSAGLSLSRNQSISIIGRTVGLIFIGFAVLSHGLSVTTAIEIIPGVAILAATELSKRWKYFGLSFLAFIVVATLVYWNNFDRVTMVTVYALFVIPFSFLFVRSFSKE
ncbi:MAG TPA: hypothetical protein PLM80_05315 [Mesotoga sp.]|jgi:bacteriorhodopsin|nr:hypothetical protein [Mesotoga sp.]MDI9374900.1 hypothetical protein [Thermotogota bacterium]NLX34726.1 hypothetical protein [Thermotogaceae bacterium]MDD4041035.1 hypothetical protein [Mesotoga sp.]MDD5744444.1 hypothetical protein [Mesotoga sp.]